MHMLHLAEVAHHLGALRICAVEDEAFADEARPKEGD
jgi:hypothetical protein